jgi:hypothetical protein
LGLLKLKEGVSLGGGFLVFLRLIFTTLFDFITWPLWYPLAILFLTFIHFWPIWIRPIIIIFIIIRLFFLLLKEKLRRVLSDICHNGYSLENKVLDLVVLIKVAIDVDD